MAVKTYAQQLEEVQAAIEAIEKRGQSYTIGDRQLTRGNLRELYEREQKLRALAAREADGGGVRFKYGTPL